MDPGVIGTSTWGPVQKPLLIQPPPLTFGERVLRRLGRILCGVGHPIEQFGEDVLERASRRVNALALKQCEDAFGPYVSVKSNAPVIDENAG